MSVGLSVFGKGIAESTLLKAESANRPISEHIVVELKQLRALIDALDRADPATLDSINRVKTLKGLAVICESCFASARAKKIVDDGEFWRHFEEYFVLAGDLVRELENACESCPPDTSVDEMARVGVHAVVRGS